MKQILMTKTIREKLEHNAQQVMAGNIARVDLEPVVKFYHPNSAGTWLFTELHDGDRLFGLCDRGKGSPELGFQSLRELEQLRAVILGRQTNFKAIVREAPWNADGHTLSEFAEAAREKGEIVDCLVRKEAA